MNCLYCKKVVTNNSEKNYFYCLEHNSLQSYCRACHKLMTDNIVYGDYICYNHGSTFVRIEYYRLNNENIIDKIILRGEYFSVKLMPQIGKLTFVKDHSDKTHIWQHKNEYGKPIFKTILTSPHLMDIVPEDVDKRARKLIPFI